MPWDFPKANPWIQTLPWVKFFQTTPRLFNSLSHFIPMSHVTFGLPSFTLCLSQFCWWFRMTWKLLTGTSLIECLIWLPGTQCDTQCDIWMRDFLLVINFMQSRLQTFSSSSLIHSILHFFLLQDFFAFPAVAFFTVFCEHWGVSQIPPNQKLACEVWYFNLYGGCMWKGGLLWQVYQVPHWTWKLTVLCGFSCDFANWYFWTPCHTEYNASKSLFLLPFYFKKT